MKQKPIICFDEGHRQEDWKITGYKPHTLNGSFSIVKSILHFNYKFEVCQQSINSTALNDVDVFVLPSPVGKLLPNRTWEEAPRTKLENSEINSIIEFVKNGGNLLILNHRFSDEFTKSNINDLTENFSFKFRPTTLINKNAKRQEELLFPITTNIIDHPITNDIDKLVLTYSGTIDILNKNNCHGIVFPEKDSIEINTSQTQFRADKNPVVVLSYFGLGKIIGCSSDAWFSENSNINYREFKNLAFIEKIFSFLTLSREDKPYSKTPRIFISHQNADKDTARLIANSLKKENFRVWFDEFEIVVGDSIIESVEEGIGKSDFFLILLSKSATQSKWVRKEYEVANSFILSGEKMKVLPVLLEECDIPSFLRPIAYADLRNINIEEGIESIMGSIKTHVKRDKENNSK